MVRAATMAHGALHEGLSALGAHITGGIDTTVEIMDTTVDIAGGTMAITIADTDTANPSNAVAYVIPRFQVLTWKRGIRAFRGTIISLRA